MKINFTGCVVPGKPKLSDGGPVCLKPDKAAVAHIINALRQYKGQAVTCTITDDMDSWSGRANRLFEGLVRKWYLSGDTDFWDLMRCAPETFDEVRMYCKIVFIGCKYEMLFGGRQIWVQSITEIGKKQFANGIDALMNHLIRKGVNIDQEKTDFNSLQGV